MKRFLCLLLTLLLCPLYAFAELNMDVAKNYITFPSLDEMTGYFRKSSEWTIVHSGNLDEHMALLLRRGDTEEDIRARFAEETLLWEAYNQGFPEDACVRMERFVNETSRSVWHLRHLSTAERRDLLKKADSGKLLASYDTFSAKFAGSGGTAYIECGFTTFPLALHESGKMHIRYLNGQEYVLTYAVRERMAGRSKLRSARENNLIRGYSPFKSLKFGVKLLPTMPDFALDEAFPTQVDLEDLTVSGAVPQGARLAVTLDQADIPCTVDGKGAFSVSLPLTAPGDHEVVFTITHGKHTDRVEAFTVNASAHRTPLTITAKPKTDALAGDHTIAGISEPGAEIVLRLDDRDAITLTADEAGAFTHTYEIMDSQAHLLYVAASAQGKDISIIQVPFYTEYNVQGWHRRLRGRSDQAQNQRAGRRSLRSPGGAGEDQRPHQRSGLHRGRPGHPVRLQPAQGLPARKNASVSHVLWLRPGSASARHDRHHLRHGSRAADLGGRNPPGYSRAVRHLSDHQEIALRSNRREHDERSLLFLKAGESHRFHPPVHADALPRPGTGFFYAMYRRRGVFSQWRAVFKRGHTPSQRPEPLGCRAHKRRVLHALPRCQARGQSHGPRGRLLLSPENSFYMDVTDACPISRRADPQD